MRFSGRNLRKAIVCSVVSLCVLPTLSSANTFNGFEGIWRGSGFLVTNEGERLKIKCKLVTTINNSGSRVSNLMNCVSTRKAMLVETKLRASDNKLEGRWKGAGNSGDITGVAQAGAIRLQYHGSTVPTTLLVSLENCFQTLKLAGELAGITELFVELKKRC